MEKTELIINDMFNKHCCSNEIDDNYMKLYDAFQPVSSGLDMMDNLFACFHYSLFQLIGELNHRIRSNKYFRAQDSRDLIEVIDDIFALQKELQGTCYYFKIKKECYFFLRTILPCLQSSNGTQLPVEIKPYQLSRYDRIFTYVNKNNEYIEPSDNVLDILKIVSTRNATFESMEIDEKLCSINQAIEFILKKDKKYISIDCKSIFSGLLEDKNIIEYRTTTNCFRHGTREMIEKRKSFTIKQKDFLVNYGTSICSALIEEKDWKNEK